jgi:hypothetical protein
MSTDKIGRIEQFVGPLAGLGGAALTMVGMTMTDIINMGAGTHITHRTNALIISQNKDRLALGTELYMVGLFLLVFYLVYLGIRLNATGRARWMASVASAAGLMTVVLLIVDVLFLRAGLHSLLTGDRAVIATVIVFMEYDILSVLAPVISAHVLASGIAIIQTSLLPKFVGWAGVGLTFIPLVLEPGLATGVFLLWVLGISTLLLVKSLRITGQPISAPERP